MRKVLVGLCNRIAYAGALALGVFDLTILPLGMPESRLLSQFLMALNLPVSLVSLFLPYEWHGLDFPLGHGAQTGARAFWNHMLIAIPVYVLLFYLVGFLWSGIQRMRHRREPAAEPPTS